VSFPSQLTWQTPAWHVWVPLAVAAQFLPQPPDEALLNTNSAGYDPLRYVALKADYDKRIGVLQQLHSMSQAEQSRAAQQQQQQLNDVRARELELLLKSMPELKKPEVSKKFWSESVDTMADYGFSEEELSAATDHRLYRVFRDLAAYRRARKSLPNVKQAVQSKPVLTGKKRMDPKVKSSREQQARSQQLRQTGDFPSVAGANRATAGASS